MADNEKRGCSEGCEKRRKKTVFRKIVDYVRCCVTSHDGAAEEDQSERPVHGMTMDSGAVNKGDEDLTSPRVQTDKHKVVTGHSHKQHQVNWDDVTVLSWSRFSAVYQHGFPVTLGEGDQGYVTLMRDKHSGKLVAVKTWHLTAGNDVRMMKETFQYEVEALVTFKGLKGFPQLIGILPDPNSAVSFSLVQEFVGDQRSKASSSLFEALQSGKLSNNEAILMGLETAEALREMHRKGWVHCDLKTDNVMIQEGSQSPPPSQNNNSGGWWINEAPAQGSIHAQLIDFGSARPLASAKMTRRFPRKMKKYLYRECRQLAPEVVEGLGRVPYSHESDIYSLGRLLKDISEAGGVGVLDRLADSCMSKNPKKRPTITTVVQTLTRLCSS